VGPCDPLRCRRRLHPTLILPSRGGRQSAGARATFTVPSEDVEGPNTSTPEAAGADTSPAAPASPRRSRRPRAQRPATHAPDGRIIFSEKFACRVSGFTIAEIEPRLFSFNAPQGACPGCDGSGEKRSSIRPDRPQRGAQIRRARSCPGRAPNPPSPYYMQVLGSPWPRVRLRAGDALARSARGDPRIILNALRGSRSPLRFIEPAASPTK